jgi:hypothetical protein
MTVFLFREDAYAATCEARVTAVHPDGVELDRTVFYAASGGQPGDTGMAGSPRRAPSRRHRRGPPRRRPQPHPAPPRGPPPQPGTAVERRDRPGSAATG